MLDAAAGSNRGLDLPSLRVVVLRRDCEEVVTSFLRKSMDRNHWQHPADWGTGERAGPAAGVGCQSSGAIYTDLRLFSGCSPPLIWVYFDRAMAEGQDMG